MSVSSRPVDALLKDVFAPKHVDAALRHFDGMVDEFQRIKWDNASAKGGKFIEASLKALWVFVGETPLAGKHFKAGAIMDGLAGKTAFPDTIRVTIPRACRFAYEIASNRGARHDPDEVDANEMDARTVLSLCSWILAEMVRFSQKGKDLAQATEAVDGLMKRRYPFAESIDGRVYANIGDSATEIALVVLYYMFPKRIGREALIETVIRHRIKRNNAKVALNRIAGYIDDDGAGMIRLRTTGLQRFEELFARVVAGKAG